MNFEQTFPLRFWINLGRREDRRLETEARLEEIGITAERFGAVDARWIEKMPETRSLNPEKRFRAGDVGDPVGQIGPATHSNDVRGYESAGRYALALTQRLAIREAARRRASAVLLFEDDVVFHPNFRALIETVELPEDWGIFYLGCTHNVPPVWAGRRVVRAGWAVDTHAIAFNAKYYKKALRILDRQAKLSWGVPKASDQFIALLHRDVPTYACYPNLAWQDVSDSDLLGAEYSSYQGDGVQVNWTDSVAHLLPELVGERIELGMGDAMMRVIPRVMPAVNDDAGFQCTHEIVPLRIWVRKPPKIGLLFLTRGDVNHPHIWREFVAEAPEKVRIFSHVKNRNAVSPGFLRGTCIKQHFDTEWGGIGLVRACRAMLLEAMEDESLTHFVLLSESCVPIRPLPEILRRLELDPRPQFGFDTIKTAHPKHGARVHGVPQVPDGCWRFQSQWWMLDRIAAIFAAGQDFTDIFAKMEVPDEAYFSTVLSMQGYPLDGSVFKKDVTWTWWKNHGSPIAWDTMPPERLQDMIHSGAMFARKFPRGADIGKYGLHRSVGPVAAETMGMNLG
jgi:hypothetical protein